MMRIIAEVILSSEHYQKTRRQQYEIFSQRCKKNGLEPLPHSTFCQKVRALGQEMRSTQAVLNKAHMVPYKRAK